MGFNKSTPNKEVSLSNCSVFGGFDMHELVHELMVSYSVKAECLFDHKA